MNSQSQLQIWDLWYPQAAATGIPFARGRFETLGAGKLHRQLCSAELR